MALRWRRKELVVDCYGGCRWTVPDKQARVAKTTFANRSHCQWKFIATTVGMGTEVSCSHDDVDEVRRGMTNACMRCISRVYKYSRGKTDTAVQDRSGLYVKYAPHKATRQRHVSQQWTIKWLETKVHCCQNHTAAIVHAGHGSEVERTCLYSASFVSNL